MIDQLAAAAGRAVSRETFDRIERYAALLRDEAVRQNLVAKSTLATMWERHILDSAQLVRFEPRPGANWLDIGSGAGLPGVVIACIVDGPITLLEPRKLRADFLKQVCNSLRLNAVAVRSKVERMTGTFDVITARGVAPLAKLLEISQHLSTTNTVWALPKGRGAVEELAQAKQAWHGMFHVKQSVTSADSYVVVGTGVRAKT